MGRGVAEHEEGDEADPEDGEAEADLKERTSSVTRKIAKCL